MTCSRCHDRPATRYVHLSSEFVSITRGFCDDCAAILCQAPPPGAGVTDGSGKRSPLAGCDLGPITSN